MTKERSDKIIAAAMIAIILVCVANYWVKAVENIIEYQTVPTTESQQSDAQDTQGAQDTQDTQEVQDTQDVQDAQDVQGTQALSKQAVLADKIQVLLTYFYALKERVETLSLAISFEHAYIELNTRFESAMGKTVFTDASNTVVKLENGYLASLVSKNTAVSSYAENLIELQSFLDEKGIDLLYVQAPYKISAEDTQLVAGLENYANENADAYLAAIEGEVDYIDLRQEMKEDGLSHYDYFFKTDHHWTPEAAFWAFGNLAETLNANYGFTIDESYYDIDNYTVTVYQDWFLGSQGKRVGTWVAGVDDISLITPNFETDFVFEVPASDIYKTGDFAETMIDDSHINTKDYWNLSAYHAYTGGDYALNIMINNLNPDGKKVLLVRDSFSCALSPFLALGCSQLDCIDLRYYKEESLMDYIDQNDYDMVIIMRNPTTLDTENNTFDSIY